MSKKEEKSKSIAGAFIINAVLTVAITIFCIKLPKILMKISER